MKSLFILSNSFLSSISSFSHDSFFVVENKDATYCSEIDFKSKSNGYLSSFIYVSKGGDKLELKGKDIPKITTIFYKDKVIDRVPLDAKKPDTYVRYLERTVDGKIKCWIKNPSFGSVSTYSFLI